MGFAILRTQKLKSLGSVRRSMKHAFREQETPNADMTKSDKNTHIGAKSVEEGMSAFAAALPEKYRKNAVLGIEYLITASPQAMSNKTREEQDHYFNDALNWLKERHGSENVIYAGIHRDEKTPHMYAYIVPKDPETGRLNCRRFLGGAKALSEMQTDFANKVGIPHGLKRGLQGSKAKHTTLKQFYAVLNDKTYSHIAPDLVKPKQIKKGLFGSKFELPETVAARVTEHYDSAIKLAATAKLEARRAEEMTKTAELKQQELEATKKRLTLLEGVFRGLTRDQQQELIKASAAYKEKNALKLKNNRDFSR